MAKKILFVFRHAPYGSALAREGLEALLAAAVYEQDVAVLFLNDGVFQLVESQQPPATVKNHSRMMAALPMYGIEKIFLHLPSLESRGLEESHLLLSGSHISDEQVHTLMAEHEQILSF